MIAYISSMRLSSNVNTIYMIQPIIPDIKYHHTTASPHGLTTIEVTSTIAADAWQLTNTRRQIKVEVSFGDKDQAKAATVDINALYSFSIIFIRIFKQWEGAPPPTNFPTPNPSTTTAHKI